MSKLGNLAGWLVLAMGLSIGLAGCSGRVSYYDDYHHDYHRWNNHEVIVYHSYYDGRHAPYREYNSLSKEEQRDYWKWRHDRH